MTSQPNILFVLADDMGYSDLGCYGGQGIDSRNIDRLAAEGIRFAQFYVNSPLCSPSRTAFTTGQYPARWRITTYIDDRAANENRGMAQWLDLKAPTLARSLASAGYMTGHFGKWHMGGGRDVGEAPLLTEFGFTQSLTQFEGLGDRVLPIMSAQDGQPERKLELGIASEKLGRGQVNWAPRSEVTTVFVNRALAFIQEAKETGKPFYINLWPDDVHSPFDPPPELRGDGSKRDKYRGVLTNMDREFAPLFDAIRQDPELRDNTLIIFTSDNGPEDGAGLAGQFRGSKGELYEGGIREPFIVWGPGLMAKDKQGTFNETGIISAVDFLPSLLKIAGVEDMPEGDGIDVSRTLLGLEESGRSQPLFWKRPPDRPDAAGVPLPDLAVREGEWKLLVQEDGAHPRLYNLSNDPGETHDLALEQPDLTQRLLKSVLDWNETLPTVKLGPGMTISTKTHFELKQGDQLDQDQAPYLPRQGFMVRARVETSGQSGVILGQGGSVHGFTLFLDKSNHLNFTVRVDEVATSLKSPKPLKGQHLVSAILNSNRSLTLKVDDEVVAQSQIPQLFSVQPNEPLHVGLDFEGRIDEVTVELESPLD